MKKIRKIERPDFNPDPSICSYYVERKRRFCKTACKPGSKFCVTHDNDPMYSSNDKCAPDEETLALREERVPCPINGNHTVFKSRLAKHVKVCPDLRFIPSNLPYYEEDKHSRRNRRCASAVSTATTSTCAPAIASDEPISLKTLLSESEMNALVGKIEVYFKDHVEATIKYLDDLCGTPMGYTESLTAFESRKHKPQHRALLRCLRVALESAAPRHRPVHGFIELGAGKGGLAVALHDALVPSDEHGANADAGGNTDEEALRSLSVASPKLVVADFDSFRRKGDSRVTHSSMPLMRLRINLKDLNLTKAFQTTIVGSGGSSDREETHWAVVGKHLCGACADFALSCITEPELGETAHATIGALVIATCCHHRCEAVHMNDPWESEAACSAAGNIAVRGPSADIGFSEQEFQALCRMSSWSVSGKYASDAKQQIGYWCKRIIDSLRVAFLQKKGFTAFQCEYIDKGTTDENVCIIAFREEKE